MGLNGDLMGLNGDLIGLNCDLLGTSWDFIFIVFFAWNYVAVNGNFTGEFSSMLLYPRV